MKRWPFWLVVVTCLGCGMLAGLILARLAAAPVGRFGRRDQGCARGPTADNTARRW